MSSLQPSSLSLSLPLSLPLALSPSLPYPTFVALALFSCFYSLAWLFASKYGSSSVVAHHSFRDLTLKLSWLEFLLHPMFLISLSSYLLSILICMAMHFMHYHIIEGFSGGCAAILVRMFRLIC
jgi:hypothetical protein